MKTMLRAASASALCLLAATSSALLANVAEVVRPEFLNELKVGVPNLPPNQASSMTLFGGNINPVDSAPSGNIPSVGEVRLVESSFGQAFATEVPYPNFTLDAILSAQAMLYAPTNWSRGDVASSDLVFRYKPLLFDGTSNGVAPDPSQMSGYFGNAERAKFAEAVKLMRDALKYAPYDHTLRNTLLDAYYDLAVAEVQFTKLDRAQIAEYRLGFRTVPASGFVVDQEITLNTNLIARYELALGRYGELLTDRMGVDVSEYDASVTNGMPLGTYIFQQEQPVRNQFAAQFYDADGVLKTVPYYDPDFGETTTNSAPRILFAGYKDYVNLLGLLREYTVSAAELARLYGMRGRRAPTDDLLSGYDVIRTAQREAQLELLLLRGLFPDFAPSPADASGLTAALNGLGVSLAELDSVRAFLDGKGNLLGFDPNFLVLIQEHTGSTEGNQFDSYDALMHWIGGRGTPSAFMPLPVAQAAFTAAVASYTTYKGNADQVWDQMDQIADTYGDRYYEITGWDPGDTTTNHILGCESGSELWQAHRSVELANTRVAKIKEQQTKLEETISSAKEMVDLATSKASRLETAKLHYFGATSNSWYSLADWRSTMAFSQGVFDTVASACTVDGIASVGTAGGNVAAIAIVGAANTLVQTVGASETTRAEQDLEKAAADYEVAQMQLDIPAEIAQARIEYRDRLREQIALALELEDARAMQSQEIARRQGLLRELEHIKQQAEESDAQLADRYYADPIHYLRAQNDMILADEAFREAQRWVFFAQRALEYKWNKDFVKTYLGRDWDSGSVFKLRNYPELSQLVGAMESFNLNNTFGASAGTNTHRISLRDDILAPAAGGTNGLWLDVETGELVSSTNLLRRKLTRSLDGLGNLVIRLNTFELKQDSGFFFVGPRYYNDGSVLSAGTYLDKIFWLKFNVVGGTTKVSDANLSYGGTCYVRTRMPPCGNPAAPFALPGEFRAFPFFYFRTLDSGVTWQTLKSQNATVKVVFSVTPGEPSDPDTANHFLRERSVAATDWVLTLPAGTFNIAQINDIELFLRHRYILREMPTCD